MRKTLVAATMVMLAAGLVWAAGQPGIVRTRGGNVYDGTIDEKDDVVAVTVRGIQTNIPRDQIQSITYGDFETRWNSAYAKLESADAAGRVAAARRAFDEHRYDLAERALRDAQAIDPNNAEAAELLKLTINQRRLEKNAPPDGVAPGVAPKPAGGWVTLDKEQINRVKQLELQENDTKARFSFKNNVQRKYFESDLGLKINFSEFSKLTPNQRALMVIKNGGDLARDVEVVNDPEIMLNFRKDIMPLVLQGCATSACHGGNNASSKKFALITPAPDAADVYTNFYVLQTYKKNISEGVTGGLFDPAFAMMIDRTQPEQSLLLQYGLSEQNAEKKHPRVRGYNGIFPRSREDQKYANIRNFIASLNRVEPDYGFSFTLQRHEPAGATPPASQPSTQPVKDVVEGVKNLLK